VGYFDDEKNVEEYIKMVDCEFNSPFPIGRPLQTVCRRPSKTSVVRIRPRIDHLT
jgi:hypothetical protein